MPQRLPIGYVHVFTNDPPLSIIARMADAPPNIEQGFGGWTEVARPRKSPITTFTGAPGLHLTLPLVFDGWARSRSVERDIAQVKRMGTPSGANGEPPRLRVAAPGSSVPYQGRWWVIDTITWGDALINFRGVRMRQEFTLALIEYVEDVHLQEKSAAARRRSKQSAATKKEGASSKRVVAKRAPTSRRTHAQRIGTGEDFGAGEDLLTIAARELGDADRWIEIATLNGLRDPRAIEPGQVIRLP